MLPTKARAHSLHAPPMFPYGQNHRAVCSGQIALAMQAQPPILRPMAKALFEINPELDRKALAQQFARDKRLQIRDFLTTETAEEIRNILAKHTPWGFAVQLGDAPPAQLHGKDARTPAGQKTLQHLFRESDKVANRGDYAFRYGQYSLVQDVQQGWNPDGPHQYLLEYLNAPDFLGIMREVTGIPELAKADGQATFYGPHNFLGTHNDSHVAEGWRIAYVMNFTSDEWNPNWGGYLVFYDEDGDIVQGYRPRFNALNLFLVPQDHAVTYTPPFAPAGRYAITGWLRDR